MPIENAEFNLPIISSANANRLLEDVGLTPKGREIERDENMPFLSLEAQARIMAREQALIVRSANRRLLEVIYDAALTTYPKADTFRTMFAIGSMAMMRLCGYELGAPFATYIQDLKGDPLEEFGCNLKGRDIKADILDGVLNASELPSLQTDAERAIGLMSRYSVESEFGEKFRMSAVLTYWAIDRTWNGIKPGNDRSKATYERLEKLKGASRGIVRDNDVDISKISIPEF